MGSRRRVFINAPGTQGRRRRAAALLAAGLVLILGGTNGGPAAADAVAPGLVTFTVGTLNDVDSLNPFTGVVAESREVWQTMYDTLTTTSATDFSPVPALATKWTTSPDGRTWTYTIRSGVTWSDGVPLTAKDVAYTFNRVLRGTYEQINYGSLVAGITRVTAPNDTTVVMRTRAPSPIMLRLAIPVLPEHVWSKIGSEQVTSYRNEGGAVGSGPFVLTERTAGQSVRLTANKNYWRGAPKIDELVYRVYGNPDALAEALRAGEVDFAGNLDADVWRSLQNVPGIKAYSGTYSGFDELAFNTGAALTNGTAIGDGNPALKNKRVRQALSFAIDREALVERTLNGNGTPGSTVIPPIYAALHHQPTDPYTFDPIRAGQLLDAAGYPKGGNGRRITPGGDPLTLRLFARQESTPSQQTARLIQGWFEDLGISITLTVITEDELTERIGQGTFDMFEWGWVVEPDPDHQLSTFTCAKRSYRDGGRVSANLSDSFYCNPAYDRLYAQQAQQINPVQRAATVRRMQQILHNDAPYAVLYDYNDLQAYSTEFTGYVAQAPPDGALLFQYGAWTYLNVRPVAAVRAASQTESDERGLPLIAIGGIAVIAVGLLLLVMRRLRAGTDRIDAG
jgi:peptide/nickel transport system substrate-binding protein